MLPPGSCFVLETYSQSPWGHLHTDIGAAVQCVFYHGYLLWRFVFEIYSDLRWEIEKFVRSHTVLFCKLCVRSRALRGVWPREEYKSVTHLGNGTRVLMLEYKLVMALETPRNGNPDKSQIQFKHRFAMASESIAHNIKC